MKQKKFLDGIRKKKPEILNVLLCLGLASSLLGLLDGSDDDVFAFCVDDGVDKVHFFGIRFHGNV